MRILVTYGSKHGSTAGIAEAIGGELTGEGLNAEVRPAGEVRDVSAYDAVVLGGALYAGRWQRDARAFARRHRSALQGQPVWLFSTGPLDSSASAEDIPPTERVEAVARGLGARGHVTFGGALAEDVEGLVASRMAASGRAGDWRDFDRVRAWAREIASDLKAIRPS